MEQNSSQGWFRYQTRRLFGVEPLCLPFTLLKPEPFLVIHMERKHLDRALYPPSQAQAFDIFKRANGLWMDVPDQARLLERFAGCGLMGLHARDGPAFRDHPAPAPPRGHQHDSGLSIATPLERQGSILLVRLGHVPWTS
jgi:hypothetical protein